MPRESISTTSAMPWASRISVIAIPAAPAPAITTFRPARSLPTRVAALSRAARTTTAVPCWSSCITGMSSSSISRASISKQRGAEMSSRFTAPKDGRSSFTVRTISSTSWVSSTMGIESRSAKVLNRAALPSITGRDAAGPMSPRPRTAEPSETTATSRPAQVWEFAMAGSAATARDTSATPGV